MKAGAFVLFLSLGAALRAADLPSFDFKSNVLPMPPLKLGDGLNKFVPYIGVAPLRAESENALLAPSMTFSSPNSQTFPDRARPSFNPRFDPKMRIVKPRSDIDFKLMVKEPNPNLDPKFVVPVPPSAKLGDGK